ncbi:Bug family tripartite tricarboxylate transporter substrate binding protein [Hydrogenophaga sp. BPS33]|uniref:Bug family tripartite tricarboxylate transporter substrate binding protein n=1 Tax=Hydrogenophaga sp. BPS33 TaxID=2651974 RepID=UPI00131F850A|nr:tripartite tricarboxylate transporter substrate binding protein [Hydrogenophaga sp. BPS33]QHE84743.1 tripartite tricarboxylate transporter substrate binding protein [Hydrogenophaga sp. BPS33]
MNEKASNGCYSNRKGPSTVTMKESQIMMKINRRKAMIAAAAAAVSQPSLAQALSWPARPVTFVVPYPAGGQMDVVARLLARNVEQIIKQPVLVDNRAGANTLIATNYVARSPADGYTFLINSSVLVSNPVVMSTAKYNAFTDFIPVARKYDWSVAWVVPPKSAQSLELFIAQARASSKPLTFGSPGHGSASHFYAEMFAKAAGIKITHVPYKGEAPIVADLLEARLDAAMVTVGLAQELSKDGRVRALAASGTRRPKSMPNLPTFGELGVPGLTAESYVGLFAPAQTPKAIVNRLNAAVNAVSASADFQKQMFANALEIAPPLTPEQFAAVVRKSSDEWMNIKSQTGIQID